MKRMWKVREQLAAALSLGILLAGGFALSAQGQPGKQLGVPHTVPGFNTPLYERVGEAAVAFGKAATIDQGRSRIRAAAEAAGWEVLRPMPDYGMAIVKISPTQARQTAGKSGVAVKNVYPVYCLPGDADLPIIATEDTLVCFQDDVPEAEAFAFLAANGLEFVMHGPGGVYRCNGPVSGAEAYAFSMALREDPRVKWAEPNSIIGVRLEMVAPKTNDPLVDNQWHIANSKLNTLNALGLVNSDCDVYRFWQMPFVDPDKARGAGVVVAVIDSGVDLAHEDLRDNLVEGRDFVDDDMFPDPDCAFVGYGGGCAHGTEVAGIIAARANNALGVSGIAPKAKIMPIRIFLDPVAGYSAVDEFRTAEAVRWAIDKRADVVNNSWGYPMAFPEGLISMVKAAFDHGKTNGRAGKGTIQMASAGNSYGELRFPAAWKSVISVGAVSDLDLRISYSCAGPNLDVVAPSQDLAIPAKVEIYDFAGNRVVQSFPALPFNTNRTGIWTTDVMGEYGANVGSKAQGDINGDYTNSFNGTSAACPVAAGCVALLMALHPDWTFEDLKANIRGFADAPGNIAQFFDPSSPDPRDIESNSTICGALGYSINLGAGRINPYRTHNRIPKPHPFRNIVDVYKIDFTGFGSSADGWTTSSINWLNPQGPSRFMVYLGEDEEGNTMETSIDQWTLVPGRGWVETPPYNFSDDEMPKVPTNRVNDYPWQSYLSNPLGRYLPGVDESLISPPIPISDEQRREYATLVVTHRFSMELIQDVLLPNGSESFELDIGWIEVSTGEEGFKLVDIIRGSTAEDPDFSDEEETLVVVQSIPLGSLKGVSNLQVKFRFLSNSMHNPGTHFGWEIARVKVVAYDLADFDYQVADRGRFPDWSSDSRSIYFSGVDNATPALFWKPALPWGRWSKDGVLCPQNYENNGYYMANPEGTNPIMGLDVHPFSNRLTASFDTTTLEGRYAVAVQSMNDDAFDGQAIASGVTVRAQHVRYSQDANWVVYTDGTHIYQMLTDGGDQTPLRITPNFTEIVQTPDGPKPMLVQLVNIGHPVFAFDDQRIIFEAGTQQNPSDLDLYILNRSSRVVERRVLDWRGGTNERMADVGIDSKRLVFVSNADPKSFGELPHPQPGSTDLLFVLNNLQSVILASRPPEVYDLESVVPIEPDPAPNPSAPYNFGSPRFSPTNDRIVYTLNDTIRIRKLNLPTSPVPPPPTPVPTSTPPVLTPTPVPTPVSEPVTFSGEIDFGVAFTGWRLVGTGLPAYSTPTLTLLPGTGHLIRSTNNYDYNTFGYLLSPPNAVSVSATLDPSTQQIRKALTLVRWWISGNVSATGSLRTPRRLPDFRLRATSSDYQDTQLVRVESRGDVAQLPSLDPDNPTPYDLILSPAPGVEDSVSKSEVFDLAFDMLNFDPTNDPQGELILHRIELYRIPEEQIRPVSSAAIMFPDPPVDPNDPTNGWEYSKSENIPEFRMPLFEHKDDSLRIESQETPGGKSYNTFGFWFRDALPAALPSAPNQLLEFSWSVYAKDGSSREPDPRKVPSFRVRARTAGDEIHSIRRLTSTGGAAYMPGKNGRIYTTHLKPVSPSTLPGTLNLAFDMLNFDPADYPDGVLGLVDLTVSVVEIDGYPQP